MRWKICRVYRNDPAESSISFVPSLSPPQGLAVFNKQHVDHQKIASKFSNTPHFPDELSK